MNAVNKTSSKIIDQIVSTLKNGYLKLYNAKGVFMPLVVEKVYEQASGIIYSFAHYGEQNWDLMRDPEVCLLQSGGDYYPLDFRNDYLGIFQETVVYNSRETVLVNAKKQAEITEFCNQWLQNIKQQQEL